MYTYVIDARGVVGEVDGNLVAAVGVIVLHAAAFVVVDLDMRHLACLDGNDAGGGVGQILAGETVDVNDTETYNNGKITVPSFLCVPVFGSADNYVELLIDSGYYTADQLQ